MNKLIKFLAYKIIPSWLYYRISFLIKKKRLDKSNNIFYNRASSKLIYKILKKIKKKKKFFILGSGSSINDLTSKNFKEIECNCSIGINKWIFHKFVADFYMIELTDIDIQNEKIRKQILLLLKNKSKKPFFLIYNLATKPTNMKRWIRGMNPNRVFFYEFLRPNIFKKGIQNEILILLKFLSTKSKVSNIITLGVGGSIVRAISLALLLQYTKIIILGVDLKNTKYFFHKKGKKHEGIDTGQKDSGLHLTAKNRFGGMPVQKSIVILDKLARRYFNSKILISTNKSLLSSKLKKYKWRDKK